MKAFILVIFFYLNEECHNLLPSWRTFLLTFIFSNLSNKLLIFLGNHLDHLLLQLAHIIHLTSTFINTFRQHVHVLVVLLEVSRADKSNHRLDITLHVIASVFDSHFMSSFSFLPLGSHILGEKDGHVIFVV